MNEFVALYRLMRARQRRLFFITLVLMLVAAGAEMLTIGAVLPFLALATGPGIAILPQRLTGLFGAIGGSSIGGAAVVLIAAAICAASIRLLLAALSQKLVAETGTELAGAAVARTLRLPYAQQVRHNSSRTLSILEQVQPVVGGVLLPSMQGLIATVIATFVAAVLFLIDPFAAALGAAAGVSIYLAVSITTRPILRRNARTLAATAAKRTRIVQEGLGGIREVLIRRAQDAVEARFREIDSRYRRAQAMNSLLATTPRFVVEAVGVAVLAIVTVVLSSKPGGIVAAIPVLGALALGAQRLLPLLQTVYQAWGQATGNFENFRRLIATATAPVAGDDHDANASPLRFRETIELERISFRFPGSSVALQQVSLRIERGEHLGIAGPTGSGKSTLIDLMVGLLDPDEGRISIDGAALDGAAKPRWQAAIGHVPQSIYLIDDTIAANIAFPHRLDQVPPRALADAVRVANVDEFVALLPDGLDTRVGERGVRLSAGQRQRIGLARALWRRPSLLILDEATSGLDEVTEAGILDSLERMEGLTIVSVSHRDSALSRCNRILRMEVGRLRVPSQSIERNPRHAGRPLLLSH